jgi:protein gp37
VPFFFKQWGEWLGGLQDGAEQDGYPPRIFNASDAPIRVGKKAAGRLLDGAEHNEFPEVRS